MRKERRAVHAIPVAARSRECLAIAGLRAELDEEIGGRQPFDLHAVLRQLVAHESLVDERLVGEVPGMRMDFVEIADAREESPALDGEAGGQGGRAEIGFLDPDFILTRDCGNQGRREIRIDAGAECEFGFAETEAALTRADFAAARNESGDAPGFRVLRRAGVAAGEYHRNGRIERRRRVSRSGAGSRLLPGNLRGKWCRGGFELLDSRLERAHARRVIVLQVLQLGAQRRDIIRGLRECAWRSTGKRQERRNGQYPRHGKVLLSSQRARPRGCAPWGHWPRGTGAGRETGKRGEG